MIDYSIGELQLACEMQFKQILKHLGVRSGMGYTIPSYFYCSVNGPRKSRLQVIAMEIKSGYLKKVDISFSEKNLMDGLRSLKPSSPLYEY
jgi:hypothetical protein